MNVRLEAEEAVRLFEQYMEEEEPIIDKETGEKYTLDDTEIFAQCYAPEHPVRKDFPTKWFIGNKGTLLSVTKTKGIKRLPPYYKKNDTEKKYPYRVYWTLRDGVFKPKNIKYHILVAMVFDSDVYGLTAKRLLQDKGVLAWKDDSETLGVRDVVATHHESKSQEHRLTPNTLETTSEEVHRLLTKVERDLQKVEPKYSSQSKDVSANKSFMQELSELAGREAPEKMTVLFTGETVNAVTGEVRYDGMTKIEEHELPMISFRIELTDNESDNSDNT